MKSFYISLGFAAMVKSQGFDFGVIDAAPVAVTTTLSIGAGSTTIEYNSATAIANVVADVSANFISRNLSSKSALKNRLPAGKRDGSCNVQPSGAGPVPSPDTPGAFLADPDFSSVAIDAQTPSGFVRSSLNLRGSNSAYASMGHTALDSYDSQTCANKCRAITGCMRSISISSATHLFCPDPPSTIVIKCVFWGGPVLNTNANNEGQWRSKFEIVIAGSNGYNTAGPFESPTGYTGIYLGEAAINAPNECNSYMGVKIFTSSPFDPALCAAACSSQSDYNRANPYEDGNFQTCQFYNTYMLLKNGGSAQQYCSLVLVTSKVFFILSC
ncbi:hypothetical protein BKA67DRAFT_641420 [Truncatella angustata]|uniref:Uncharacterized protein n=1 Tax=Truncatella angustata TaxID=152316 RepID=A0A9P8UXS3_9PEZI|nr:uncharacterized protein BKA67DRAFT_641420 [Truncatella angustata]KAH6660297.1 hypothetical protein BKA67DRAFT_641420 [Truncatella angustata]